MAYSPKDREEFAIQIKELLDLKVIEPSKSPFSSPAFTAFGLKQAPGIFQRHMDNTFKQFNKFCCVYIDDILIFSDSEEEHEKHVLQDLAKMRTPLQKKLKKDYKWNWSKEDSLYVRKIKSKLKNLPPLYHPHKDDKMIIETDASQEFWGAALKAITEENEEKLCSYASGTFNSAEKNYLINEK
ncbi:RNA-directed DNA polymerase [Abeliophyllum distichum]|uniref:RNA-directed DNA polymerase n=1 Tax=Abeliophyllum distichum TaxID=126358 RepID=A0ABD1QUA8_9LAMI